MIARKTKRVAVVTAVSASLVMAGAAAFAKPSWNWPPCPRGNGQGQGQGHAGGPGNGYENGWPHKPCKDNGENGGGNTGGGNPGGGNPGGGNPGGGNPGGGTNSDNDGISVDVNVEVNLPNIVVPNAATAADDVLDHAFIAVGQTVTLAESDVAGLMAIVGSAGQGTTSLVTSTAGAGVSVSGTGASGTINVSGGAAGTTTLGSTLLGSTRNLVDGNVSGGGSIVGTMLSML